MPLPLEAGHRPIVAPATSTHPTAPASDAPSQIVHHLGTIRLALPNRDGLTDVPNGLCIKGRMVH